MVHILSSRQQNQALAFRPGLFCFEALQACLQELKKRKPVTAEGCKS